MYRGDENNTKCNAAHVRIVLADERRARDPIVGRDEVASDVSIFAASFCALLTIASSYKRNKNHAEHQPPVHNTRQLRNAPSS